MVSKKQVLEMNAEFGQGNTGKEIKDILFNTRDKYMHVMGCPDPIGNSLCSIFSGADICAFFGEEIIPVLSVYMFAGTSTCMELILPMGEDAFKILRDKATTFHIIGVTESGDKGLISGSCNVTSWSTKMSVDELNIEMRIVFNVTIDEMKGFMGVKPETNEYITAKWHELTQGKYKKD